MVERWSQQATPTATARLAQARALLDLCMMDRAWTRLQTMPDGTRHEAERLALTARMFIQRGWPSRAEELLTDAVERYPDHPDWPELQAEAKAPPRRAPSVEPPSDAPLAQQVEAARAFLATGAFLKAKRLLEALQREGVESREVRDLQWALRGDYDLGPVTLTEVVKRLAPKPPAIGELADFEDDPDNTDAVTVADVPAGDLLDGGRGSFPDLFGLAAAGRADPGPAPEPEDTQSTPMADIEAAVAATGFGHDEDTQVLRVVSAPSAPAPEAPEPVAAVRPQEIEAEDAQVVVITRQQAEAPPVVDDDLAPIDGVEDAVPPPPPPPLEDLEVLGLDDEEPSGIDHRIWWLTLAGVALGGTGVLLLLVVMLGLV